MWKITEFKNENLQVKILFVYWIELNLIMKGARFEKDEVNIKKRKNRNCLSHIFILAICKIVLKYSAVWCNDTYALCVRYDGRFSLNRYAALRTLLHDSVLFILYTIITRGCITESYTWLRMFAILL